MSDTPRGPGHSEATRLLCAGVRLNAAFRQRVIDELAGHAERPVPPSLGVNVKTVLAHALNARRQEVRTALSLLAVWVGFYLAGLVMTWDALEDSSGGEIDIPVTVLLSEGLPWQDQSPVELTAPTGWVLWYAAVVLALWLGRAVSGRETVMYARSRITQRLVRSRGQRWLGACVTFAARVLAGLYWISASLTIAENPYPVIFPLLLAAVVWLHQIKVGSALREQLGQESFIEAPQPELPPGERYRRLGRLIDREQYAPATLYDPHRPFVGAGVPRKPWSFALELQRKKPGGVPPQGDRESKALSSRHVIDMIKPRLSALRDSAARTSRDRLRRLEIEEVVYLPAGVHRDGGVYEPEQMRSHLADAVDEGAEARRHFLRIRIGAWDEQVVVSLLVRVHTQGGMLVLEVLPHVLGPIVEEFREVDAIAERRCESPAREGLRALLASPTVTVTAGIAALRALASFFRIWLASPENAAPDAPLTSVREMASMTGLSLFQEMDVSRYIKTVQDRIASGVRDALEQRGYRTDRFEQQIVNISNGGVFIGEMSGGAVATGEHGRAHHMEGSTA